MKANMLLLSECWLSIDSVLAAILLILSWLQKVISSRRTSHDYFLRTSLKFIHWFLKYFANRQLSKHTPTFTQYIIYWQCHTVSFLSSRCLLKGYIIWFLDQSPQKILTKRTKIYIQKLYEDFIKKITFSITFVCEQVRSKNNIQYQTSICKRSIKKLF